MLDPLTRPAPSVDSSFSTARTHIISPAGSTSSKTSTNLDSSEGTPSLNSDIYDEAFWQTGADEDRTEELAAFIQAMGQQVDAFNQHLAATANGWKADGTTEGLIRPHGIPLHTITEQSSAMTLPALNSTSSPMIDTSRKVSAPTGATDLVGEQRRVRLTKSLDDNKLARSETASEATTAFPSFASAYESHKLSQGQQSDHCVDLTRMLSEAHQPPADVQNATPGPHGKRRPTSAYVRGLYKKLIGSQGTCPSSEFHVCGDVCTASVSPQQAVEETDIDSIKQKPLPGDPTVQAEPVVVPKNSQDAPRQQDVEIITTHGSRSSLKENMVPRNPVKKRLSQLIKRTSHFLERHSSTTLASPKESEAVETPIRPRSQPSPETPPQGSLQYKLSRSTLDLHIPGSFENSPAKSFTTSVLTPEPLVIRSRSTSHADQNLQGPTSIRVVEQSELPATPKQAEETRIDSGHASPVSPASFADSLGSRALNLTPTAFPSPPSPNVYSTARARPGLYDATARRNSYIIDNELHHGTSVTTLEKFRATEDEASPSKNHASTTSSTPGSSFIAGRSLFTTAASKLGNTSDVFLSIPRLKITNPSDEIESKTNSPARVAARAAHASTTQSTTSTLPKPLHSHPLNTSAQSSPIHPPSPLRPRRKPRSSYSLFPDTKSPEARIPPFAPGMPILGALRSVSSRLRGNGVVVEQSVAQTQAEGTNKRESVTSFASVRNQNIQHPLHSIEQTRARAISKLLKKEKSRRRRERLRKVAVWVPTHCFCQPWGEEGEMDEVVGGYVERVRVKKMEGKRGREGERVPMSERNLRERVVETEKEKVKVPKGVNVNGSPKGVSVVRIARTRSVVE